MGEWEETTKSLLAPTNLREMIQDISKLQRDLEKIKPEMKVLAIQQCQKMMGQEYERLKEKKKLSNSEIYIYDECSAYTAKLLLQLKDCKNATAFANQLSSLHRYYQNLIEKKRDPISMDKKEIIKILVRLQQKYSNFYIDNKNHSLHILIFNASKNTKNVPSSFEIEQVNGNGEINDIVISYTRIQKPKYPNAYEFLRQLGMAFGNILFKDFYHIPDNFLTLCDELDMSLEEESYIDTFSEIFAIVNDTDHNGGFAVDELGDIDEILTHMIKNS